MREAVGGSLLFYIIIGIIFVFIVFIGFIMSYAASYRASNYVLTMIERTEGNALIGNESDQADVDTLYGQLRARKYYNKLDVCCTENDNGAVYRIKTYVPFQLPLIDVTMNLEIANETKTIYGVKCNSSYPSCDGNVRRK